MLRKERCKMLKDGVMFYANARDMRPKDAWVSLKEYLSCYIFDYLMEKKNFEKQKALNIGDILERKFYETQNLYEATDEAIEKFVDKELEQGKIQ